MWTQEKPRPARVALAEDDDVQRSALDELLRAEGFEVVELEDGYELKDYFSMNLSRWVDAVVADLNMPGCSGLEGLETARQRGLTLPIVVVTGETGDAVRERVERLGNAVFLQKPVDVSVLARTLHALTGWHGS